VPNAKYDAQILLARVLNCKRLDLFLRFEEPLPESALEKYRDFVRRRAKREPLQHILGDVEFFGVKLKCDARALVPRHETEELADILTRKFFTAADAPLKILDLGCGSGALLLALLNHYPNAEAAGVDISEDALSLSKENAAALGFEARAKIARGDWFEGVDGEFDLIVANPPYLTSAEYESAAPEVKNYDPPGALVSPAEGLGDALKILKDLAKHLKQGGIAAFECGLDQPSKLCETLPQGVFEAECLNDASHRERFLILRKL